MTYGASERAQIIVFVLVPISHVSRKSSFDSTRLQQKLTNFLQRLARMICSTKTISSHYALKEHDLPACFHCNLPRPRLVTQVENTSPPTSTRRFRYSQRKFLSATKAMSAYAATIIVGVAAGKVWQLALAAFSRLANLFCQTKVTCFISSFIREF